MFHILQRRNCVYDPTHAKVYERLEVETDGLIYEKQPVKIID